MDYKPDIVAFLLFTLSALKLSNGSMFQGNDRLLLNDLKVLTLHQGQMTTARRSDPIPQLRCLGGSAQCSFTPTTVQCYNKGSDGFDVQWECKADIDNSYRFGKVEVSCEGFDYPDDPYVLRGSCGLEYTLDYTKDGYQKQKHNHNHNSYGSNSQHYGSNSYSSQKKHSSWFGDLITLGIVGAIIYGIYKTCLTEDHSAGGRASAGGYDQYRSSGSNPPPPGFRSEYMPDGCSSSYGRGYGTNYGRRGTNWFGNTGFGGFWGGAATGGMLGYLLGNRNGGYGHTYTQHQPRNTGWGFGGNSWGSGGSNFGGGSSMGSSFGGSGTRTASGFGGTKRR